MKLNLILFAASMYLVACNSVSTSSTKLADTTAQNANAAEQTSPQSDTSGDALMKSMNDMMSRMHSIQMSGDFDKDFASMMIEHHQGAIDMSKIEVAQGSDEKMKSMAQNIITKQTGDQNKLRDMLNNMKPAGMKMGEGELQNSMSALMNKMQTMQMTGNIDKDFATMMASHHEDGIAMAKLELKNGMNSQLKQMAQKEVDDQQKEVKEFKDWLSANK